jgi:hypothetical protein
VTRARPEFRARLFFLRRDFAFYFPVMLKRDVILELSFVGDVCCGIDAGESAEIVNEMSLIEVAARQRDLRPIDHGACRQCAQVV